MHIPIKQSWLDRAKETRVFHVHKKKENPAWTVNQTAKSLRRSVGSISEDLLLASWDRTHHEELSKFDYIKDALAFIRKRAAELELSLEE